MDNHYKTLGVKKNATPKEIRKAYRALARKYHPDINKDPENVEYFKRVTEAYNILHDPEKRLRYDRLLDAADFDELDAKMRAYKATLEREEAAKKQREEYEKMLKLKEELLNKKLQEARESFLAPIMWLKKLFNHKPKTPPQKKQDSFHSNRKDSNIIFIDLILSLNEALTGCNKVVPIPGNNKKIKIKIPAGSRPADTFRSKLAGEVEVVCVVKKVVAEPYASYDPTGVIFDLPITIKEALLGTEITVPTFNGPRQIKIQPNTNSGYIIRLHKCGVNKEDDLLYRIMISVPETTLAVGIREKAEEMDRYYEKNVREAALKSLYSITNK